MKFYQNGNVVLLNLIIFSVMILSQKYSCNLTKVLKEKEIDILEAITIMLFYLMLILKKLDMESLLFLWQLIYQIIDEN